MLLGVVITLFLVKGIFGAHIAGFGQARRRQPTASWAISTH
jgi:hypothetical protein